MQNPQTKLRKSLYNACNDWQMSSSTDNNPVFIPTALLYYSCEITLLKYAVWCANTIPLFGEKIIVDFSCALYYTTSLWQGHFTPHWLWTPLDSMSVNPHYRDTAVSSLNYYLDYKKGKCSRGMFLARFQSRTKTQEHSVFFSIVTASKGHLLD